MRGIYRTAKTGAWEIESCELPVPGEPAKVFSLSVRNCGDAPADIELRLTDASRMSWMNHRRFCGDRSVLRVRSVRPGESRKFFGGRILTDTPHARWFLGKIFEDGDGLFARSTWAPLSH